MILWPFFRQTTYCLFHSLCCFPCWLALSPTNPEVTTTTTTIQIMPITGITMVCTNILGIRMQICTTSTMIIRNKVILLSCYFFYGDIKSAPRSVRHSVSSCHIGYTDIHMYVHTDARNVHTDARTDKVILKSCFAP